MVNPAAELRNLLLDNLFAEFFAYWRENVKDSPLTARVNVQQAAWRQLATEQIDGTLIAEQGEVRRAKLSRSLFDIVDALERGPVTLTPDPPKPNPLRDLVERKLTALRTARIVSVDASEKFKLDLEIAELEKQLESL